METQESPPPAEWACVEVFGHRKHYGRTQEVERFGTKMLRVDVPAREEGKFDTFFYGGASIFSFTPMTEESARKWAERDRPYEYKPMAILPRHDLHEPEDEEGDFAEVEPIEPPPGLTPVTEPAPAPLAIDDDEIIF